MFKQVHIFMLEQFVKSFEQKVMNQKYQASDSFEFLQYFLMPHLKSGLKNSFGSISLDLNFDEINSKIRGVSFRINNDCFPYQYGDGPGYKLAIRFYGNTLRFDLSSELEPSKGTIPLSFTYPNNFSSNSQIYSFFEVLKDVVIYDFHETNKNQLNNNSASLFNLIQISLNLSANQMTKFGDLFYFCDSGFYVPTYLAKNSIKNDVNRGLLFEPDRKIKTNVNISRLDDLSKPNFKVEVDTYQNIGHNGLFVEHLLALNLFKVNQDYKKMHGSDLKLSSKMYDLLELMTRKIVK